MTPLPESLAAMVKKEEWRPIPGYEGSYECSDIGVVRGLTRKVNSKSGIKRIAKGRILSKFVWKGYWFVFLSKDSKRTAQRISRLVAQTFIPNPENKPDVNHKNGIKADNTVGNLEWVTRKENSRHAYDTGLNKGPQHYHIARKALSSYNEQK